MWLSWRELHSSQRIIKLFIGKQQSRRLSMGRIVLCLYFSCTRDLLSDGIFFYDYESSRVHSDFVADEMIARSK